MTLDPRLAALRRDPLSNAPRYYAPGQHPATLRLRRSVAMLEAIGQGDHEAARFARDEIARFEEGESEAKARDLAALESLERRDRDD